MKLDTLHSFSPFMSTASSHPWAPASQLVRHTKAAVTRLRASMAGTPRRLSVAACVGALTGSALGVAFGASAGAEGVALGVVLGGPGGALFFKSIGTNLYRRACPAEPYYASPDSFEDYGPAYRFGHETCLQYRGRRFEEMEPELERLWRSRDDAHRLAWHKARNSVRRIWSVWAPG